MKADLKMNAHCEIAIPNLGLPSTLRFACGGGKPVPPPLREQPACHPEPSSALLAEMGVRDPLFSALPVVSNEF